MSNDEKKFQPIFQILYIKSAWFLQELAMALVTTIGMRFLQVCTTHKKLGFLYVWCEKKLATCVYILSMVSQGYLLTGLFGKMTEPSFINSFSFGVCSYQMHLKDFNPVVNINSIDILIDPFRLILLEMCVSWLQKDNQETATICFELTL